MPTKEKAPTLAEVRAVVRAWLKANWPDAKHVSLCEWDRGGGGLHEVDVLGPPKKEAWYTNNLPIPPLSDEELIAIAEEARELLAAK